MVPMIYFLRSMRQRHDSIPALLRGFLLLAVAPLLAGCPRPVSLPLAPPEAIDFAVFHRDALLAQAAYGDAAAVRALVGPDARIHVQDLPGVESRYFLAVSSGAQILGVRGTANLRNAVIDSQVADELDPVLGIRLHRGFARATQAVLADALPRLDKDRPVRLVGHSLGGAEAVILGMHLVRQGYRVERIVTFGQPQVTNRRGGDAFADLPLLRISDDRDMVPFLPPAEAVPFLNSYRHFGPEIVLYGGSDYRRAASRPLDRPRVETFLHAVQAGDVPPDIREHFIATYVERLAALRTGAVEMPGERR
jgi:triacylglycerol lipase